MRKLVLACAFATVLAGCSSSITYEAATSEGTGIRYYEQSPYLLIYSNSKGGLKWQITYLPDQTKKMMASPQVVGGRSELTMFFQNGVLTGSAEAGDTTAIPKAAIAALQSVVPLLAAMAAPTSGTVPPPYIYKIVVKNGSLNFIGGKGDVGIEVPLQ